MPFGQLLSFVDGIPAPWNTIIKWVLCILGLGYLLIKTVKIVPQDEEAMRTRFGAVVTKNGIPIILKPGLHILFPFAYNIVRVNVLEFTCEPSTIRLRFGRFDVVDVAATIVFAIEDIYKVRYVAQDLKAQVTAACAETLRHTLSGLDDSDFAAHRDEIVEKFRAGIERTETKLGVRFVELNLTNISAEPQFAIAGAIHHFGTTRAA